MSHCKIMVFKNGKAEYGAEFGNSWGGAAFIWSKMFDEYVKDPCKPYDSWLSTGRDKELWKLASCQDVPLGLRAVLSSTYDNAIIRREHFAEFVRHLREFHARFCADDGWSHLTAWADFIEKCEPDVSILKQSNGN